MPEIDRSENRFEEQTTYTAVSESTLSGDWHEVTREIVSSIQGLAMDAAQSILPLCIVGIDPEFENEDLNPSEAHLDSLLEQGRLKEMVDFILTLNDRSTILHGLFSIETLDADGKALRQIAADQSLPGRVALTELMRNDPAQARLLLVDHLKTGSLLSGVIERNISPEQIWSLVEPNSERVFEQLEERASRDPKMLRQFQLAVLDSSRFRTESQILAVEKNEKLNDRATKPLDSLRRKFAAQLVEVGDEAVKAELFEISLRGNVIASEALEKIWALDPHYKDEHRSRSEIPEAAIQEFHLSARKIASRYGLTAAEFITYKNLCSEHHRLYADIKEFVTNGEQWHVRQSVSNQKTMFEQPDIVRKALNPVPSLLNRYEKALSELDEREQIEKRLGKITELLSVEVQKLADSVKLPEVKFGHRRMEFLGTYRAQGYLTVDSDRAYTARGLSSPDFVNTIVHELGHMEHDSTFLRALLEKHGLTSRDTISREDFLRVAQDYRKLTKCDLEKKFFDHVVAQFHGRPMNNSERLRAQRIAVDWALKDFNSSERSEMHVHAKTLGLFARSLRKITSWEDVQSLLATHQKDLSRITKLRPELSSIDGKVLQVSSQAASSADFNSETSKQLRMDLVNQCMSASQDLVSAAHLKYRNQFREKDTETQGQRAATIVESLNQKLSDVMTDEEIRLFLDESSTLNETEFPTQLKEQFERTFSESIHRTFSDVLRQVTIVVGAPNSNSLGPRLTFRRANGQVFAPTAFDRDSNAFLAAKTQKVPLSDCNVEITVSGSTSTSEINKEALMGLLELKEKFFADHTRSAILTELSLQALGERIEKAIQRRVELEPRNSSNAIKSENALPDIRYEDGRISVSINGKKLSSVQIVEKLLDEKAGEYLRDESARQNRTSELNKLRELHDALIKGDPSVSRELAEILMIDLPDEVMRQRKPWSRHTPLRAAGKASAYTMVTGYIASLITANDHERRSTTQFLLPPSAK